MSSSHWFRCLSLGLFPTGWITNALLRDAVGVILHMEQTCDSIWSYFGVGSLMLIDFFVMSLQLLFLFWYWLQLSCGQCSYWLSELLYYPWHESLLLYVSLWCQLSVNRFFGSPTSTMYGCPSLDVGRHLGYLGGNLKISAEYCHSYFLGHVLPNSLRTLAAVFVVWHLKYHVGSRRTHL